MAPTKDDAPANEALKKPTRNPRGRAPGQKSKKIMPEVDEDEAKGKTSWREGQVGQEG